MRLYSWRDSMVVSREQDVEVRLGWKWYVGGRQGPLAGGLERNGWIAHRPRVRQRNRWRLELGLSLDRRGAFTFESLSILEIISSFSSLSHHRNHHKTMALLHAKKELRKHVKQILSGVASESIERQSNK